jgi:DNA-directed RNA polymerase subunit beta
VLAIALVKMLIGKGAKFNAKELSTIDYQNVNPLGWTGDEKPMIW